MDNSKKQSKSWRTRSQQGQKANELWYGLEQGLPDTWGKNMVYSPQSFETLL